MAIPPADADDTETRRFFAQMRELLARADARHYDRAQMDILSMGMSHDYAAAIAEGATIVRVGTAIYGARDYRLAPHPALRATFPLGGRLFYFLPLYSRGVIPYRFLNRRLK